MRTSSRRSSLHRKMKVKETLGEAGINDEPEYWEQMKYFSVPGTKEVVQLFAVAIGVH